MNVAGKFRVLCWRWGLSPGESQAAEYAERMGFESFQRNYTGPDRTRRKIERAVAKRAGT